MATKSETTIEIRPIQIQRTTIRIVGDSPLICHAWSEKAKRMMLEAQQGKAKGKKKDIKNPVDDFIRSLYWLTPMPEDGTEESFVKAVEVGARWGFPATAIKQAAINAAFRKGWSKNRVSLQGAFFIESDPDGLVEIHSETPPTMREDMVRIGMGTADIRYRGEFQRWWMDLTIRYDTSSEYSLENIINMVNAGGYCCGIGEWRPEKDGMCGMFHVQAGN